METYREQLIASITANGRHSDPEPYKKTMAAIPAEIAGVRGRVEALTIYPIKALGGISLQKALVTSEGLATAGSHFSDRSAMLVIANSGRNSAGVDFDFSRFSIRNERALARIKGAVDHKTLSYCLPDSDIEQLIISSTDLAPHDGENVSLEVIPNEVVRGVLENGPITEWVRAYLRAHRINNKYNIDDVHVALRPENYERNVDPKLSPGRPAQTLFSDGGQVLLASRSTHDWLADVIEANGGPRIPLETARPNIVVAGLSPNLEDLIATAEILTPRARGGINRTAVTLGDPCVRCPVTTVHPLTGESFGGEPLATMARIRPPRADKQNSATIDMNCSLKPEPGRIINVGDAFIAVTEKR